MEKRYIIDTIENRDYTEKMACELIKFGRRFPSVAGSAYYLDRYGKPCIERAKETYITCRMAHVYSIAAMMGYEGCIELAEKAVDGLLYELSDTENGGFYSGIYDDGRIVEGKLCYAHAFVILAATSAGLAGCKNADILLKKALADYDRYFWDEEEGLALDCYDTSFEELSDYRGLNSNMHSVEAFLAAYDALGEEKYRVRAGRIIDRVINWAENNNYRIPEHFTKDWVPDFECNADKKDDCFKPYGATCGHGIEWARLITQYAMSFKATEIERDRYIKAAQCLYERARSDGWNCENVPGIVYTTDWEGRPIVKDRMHWTLAEAINTSAVLYRVTGEEQYSQHYSEYMQYLEASVHDKEYGSWFHQLDETNLLKETVWPGKPDIYHAFQSMLIPYSDSDISIAAYYKMRLT